MRFTGKKVRKNEVVIQSIKERQSCPKLLQLTQEARL